MGFPLFRSDNSAINIFIYIYKWEKKMETVYETTQMTEITSVNDEKTFKYMSIYFKSGFKL